MEDGQYTTIEKNTMHYIRSSPKFKIAEEAEWFFSPCLWLTEFVQVVPQGDGVLGGQNGSRWMCTHVARELLFRAMHTAKPRRQLRTRSKR